MIVKENIEFKRGQESKSALDIGIKELNKNLGYLKKYIADDLKLYGIIIIHLFTNNLLPSVIIFNISDKNYDKYFQKSQVNLSNFLAVWLDANTYLSFEELRRNTDNTWSLDVHSNYDS